MKKVEKKTLIELFRAVLLDKQKYDRLVKLATYSALFLVAVVMTILNIFNLKDTSQNFELLTYTTGILSVLLLINFILTICTKFGEKLCEVLFAFELLAMFCIFLYFGVPDGFSILWAILLPVASLVFYGRLWGTIISGTMFIILVAMFWTPLGDAIGMYQNYGQTFKIRFPILYLASYGIAYILESIQVFQFDALEKTNKINALYSARDQLTGLYNRKGFYDRLEKELNGRNYDKIGFIIFDLDHFKNLNDEFGHLAGDKVLTDFSNLLREFLTEALAFCRWGGEEFLACYIDDSIKKSDLDEFRKKIQEHVFEYEGKSMKLTVSGGVYETGDKKLTNRDTWLFNADKALYKAKESGRNRIIYF